MARSISNEKLSAQAAELIDADGDDASAFKWFGVASPEAATIAGLDMPVSAHSFSREYQHGSDDGDGGDSLRPSGDSTEDLQRQVATAIASAENAMAMATASPRASPASTSPSPLSTSAGSPNGVGPSDLSTTTSDLHSAIPSLDLHSQEQNIETEHGQKDDRQECDTTSSLSLAAILGDDFSESSPTGALPNDLTHSVLLPEKLQTDLHGHEQDQASLSLASILGDSFSDSVNTGVGRKAD